MKPTLLIMAAGMGSRYGGLKQLDAVGPCNETIMDYSVYDAIRAGFGDVVFVVRESFKEEFQKKVADRYAHKVNVKIVTQEPNKLPEGFSLNVDRQKPWGTGQAVLMAADVIDKPFALINADDFYGRNSFEVLAKYLSGLDNNSSKKYCMVGFYLSKTLSESGGVARGICTENEEGFLTNVEEHTNIYELEGEIMGTGMDHVEHVLNQEACTSMNMWGFTPDFFTEGRKLFADFLAANIKDKEKEFYVPSVVDTMIKQNLATVKVLSTPDKWFGVTYKEDKPKVIAKIKMMTDNGTYPSPLF
ncbi:MAG: nucleotidyltransferase [Bacteroidales bacterium]|jgi:choline kinase|nr:nucleotidyltransferase [Bacteroidales bacterium]MCI1733982.1 nucleotidyltransferase [Bacteroidales bacterium]